jgi:hypothetical protein
MHRDGEIAMTFILLPLLEMHFCTYVIIGAKGNIETQVATALAPFDESLEVARYKVYLEEAEIKRMAGHYGLEMSDSPALIEKMPDWRGTQGGLDEIGLFSWATANPEGRWDWYEIGGRWSGPFGGRNVVKVKTLFDIPNLKNHLPHCIVAPAGQWHEVETLIHGGCCTFGSVRKSDGQWLIELKQVLARYPDDRVVCVDIHR